MTISTHVLGVAEALRVAAALGRLPTAVFVGISIADVRAGRPPSAAVAGAIPALVDLVQREVERLLA